MVNFFSLTQPEINLSIVFNSSLLDLFSLKMLVPLRDNNYHIDRGLLAKMGLTSEQTKLLRFTINKNIFIMETQLANVQLVIYARSFQRHPVQRFSLKFLQTHESRIFKSDIVVKFGNQREPVRGLEGVWRNRLYAAADEVLRSRQKKLNRVFSVEVETWPRHLLIFFPSQFFLPNWFRYLKLESDLIENCKKV